MSRHCQISIATYPGWDFVSELDSYCVAELQFWLSSIKKYNSKNCFQSLSHHQIVYSDASGFACGAIILNNDTQICHRPFTQEERVSVLLIESSLLLTTVSKLLGRFSVILESNGLPIVSHQFELLKWEACSFPYIRSLLAFLNFVFGIT